MGFEQDAIRIEEVVQGRDPAFDAIAMPRRLAGLDAMHAAARGLDRDAFLLAALRVVALPRNGHSRIIPNPGIRVAPRRIVMRDGAPVMVTGDTLSQIALVNGVPAQQVMSGFADLLAGTDMRQRMLSGMMLAWPAALRVAGVATDVLRYTLADGTEVAFAEADLRPALPLYPVSDNGFADPGRDDHALENGGYAQWQDGLWRVRLPTFKDVRAAELAEISDTLATRPEAGVIVDLRGNTGGDFTKAMGLVDWMGNAWRGSRCAILVNGYTFSAAIVVAVLLVHRLGARARVIGEPLGDTLAFFAEGDALELPQSGALLRYSTGWHDWSTGRATDTTPQIIARHMVGIGALEVVPVPAAQQMRAARAFAHTG